MSKAPDVSAIAQQKLIDLMDGIQHGAVSVGNAVVKYTPDVVKAGLDVVRIDGAGDLIIGLGFALGTLVMYKMTIKIIKADEDMFAVAVFTGVAGIVFLLPACYYLLDIWNYIALVEPKLYVAKQLMDKVSK